jgi:hypothetical protein
MLHKLAVRVWKYIPGVAWLWFRVVEPVWNFIVSNLEALRYIGRRSDAKQKLANLKGTIQRAEDMPLWYDMVDFRWSSDPMGGLIDFHSKPWVSVVKNRGDCDDMAYLSRYLLRDLYDRAILMTVWTAEGKGHAILIVHDEDVPDVWIVMSNQHMHKFTTYEAAVRFFYGDQTYWSYVL